MALPKFLYYYWAANMQPMLHRMRADDDSPAWCLMESSSCAPASLSAIIASFPQKNLKPSYQNPNLILLLYSVWLLDI